MKSGHHQRAKQTLSWVNSKYDDSIGGPTKAVSRLSEVVRVP